VATQPQASSSITPSSLEPVREHLASHVIGQHKLIDGMLVCLLSDGHLLVEGMPGLAKTTAVTHCRKPSRVISTVFSLPLTCCLPI